MLNQKMCMFREEQLKVSSLLFVMLITLPNHSLTARKQKVPQCPSCPSPSCLPPSDFIPALQPLTLIFNVEFLTYGANNTALMNFSLLYSSVTCIFIGISTVKAF